MEKKNKILIMVITLICTIGLEIYFLIFMSGNWVYDLGDGLRFVSNYYPYHALSLIFGLGIIIEIVALFIISQEM